MRTKRRTLRSKCGVAPRKNIPAFTLLELISALSLLVVLASIAVPSFYRGFMTHRTLDQSVDKVVEILSSAKRKAIEQSSSIMYEFLEGSNSQVVYPILDREAKQLYSLPSDVRLEGKTASAKGMVQILFREDGTTDDVTVTVRHGELHQDIRLQRHLGIPQKVFHR